MGSLSKRPEVETVSVSVGNTGNLPQMVMTLFHELRHMQQNQELDTLRSGTFLSMKNPQRSHILALMYEADAFTSETIFALERKKQGDSQYYDSMVKHGHDLAKVTARYIRSAPVSYDKDPEAFRRGLFAHVMLEGLAGYSAGYFLTHAANFERADTRKKMITMLADEKPVGAVKNDSALANVYGSKYMSKASVPVAASVFFKALPDAEQHVLKLMDKTIRNLDNMTEDAYQKARKEISTAAKDIYMTDPEELSFSRKTLAIRSAIRQAATADLPALRKDFMHVAQRPQMLAASAPRPAGPGFK
jgi:hypothetical protein